MRHLTHAELHAVSGGITYTQLVEAFRPPKTPASDSRSHPLDRRDRSNWNIRPGAAAYGCHWGELNNGMG